MEKENALEMIMELRKNRDQILQELLDEMLRSASNYASMRLAWFHMTREEKKEKDSLRSGMHDRFMDNLNILLRYLDRLEINHEGIFDYNDRKEAGDFACLIAYRMMIESR